MCCLVWLQTAGLHRDLYTVTWSLFCSFSLLKWRICIPAEALHTRYFQPFSPLSFHASLLVIIKSISFLPSAHFGRIYPKRPLWEYVWGFKVVHTSYHHHHQFSPDSSSLSPLYEECLFQGIYFTGKSNKTRKCMHHTAPPSNKNATNHHITDCISISALNDLFHYPASFSHTFHGNIFLYALCEGRVVLANFLFCFLETIAVMDITTDRVISLLVTLLGWERPSNLFYLQSKTLTKCKQSNNHNTWRSIKCDCYTMWELQGRFITAIYKLHFPLYIKPYLLKIDMITE